MFQSGRCVFVGAINQEFVRKFCLEKFKLLTHVSAFLSLCVPCTFGWKEGVLFILREAVGVSVWRRGTFGILDFWKVSIENDVPKAQDVHQAVNH
ncbi:hypothetical protein VNO78_10746 [Psophocarpus tetragonolobus]|uniref:Uncharacterized protein n=1 Tax=Psophocarpus tetragonolobus TaxID=3891 RepID=A0AAN9SMY4_PSOTE